MPLIDLKSSPGALPAEETASLADLLTAALLKHRGVPDDERSRRNVWLFWSELPTWVGGQALASHMSSSGSASSLAA